MNYIDYEEKLDKTVKSLPQEAQMVFSELPVISMMEQIGGGFNLTMGEIGEMCELVRQVITREREPKDFEAGLTEKLDEDNREKVPDIVVVLSQAVFSILLPALNIKVPIELAVRVAPPKVEGLEIAPLAPAHPVPTPRTAPPSASVPPPTVAGATLHQTYRAPSVSTPKPVSKPNTSQAKPPIMETSHEPMAVNPLESLMQMLEGRVSPKDLSRQFEKLPESLKTALGSVDSAKKIVDIGRKYALHMDKLGELGAETGMVILGFTHPAQFLSRLTKRLGMSEEKVRPIAQEINTEVFLKIREALKVVHGENEEQKPAAVPPAPISTQPVPTRPKYQGETPIKPATSPIPIKTESGLLPSEEEEALDREAILRDIENPTPTNSSFQAVVTKTLPRENPRDFGTEVRPTTPAVSIPKEIPQKIVTPEPAPLKIPAASIKTEPIKIETIIKPPVIPALEKVPNPPLPTPSELSSSDTGKFRGQAPIPLTPEPEIKTAPTKPQNIIDRKLSGVTSSTKSESNYASDPYRETI